MEDIYDDLDNYNNVNAVQELRHENMELKVKLEEHATAMEKLQKDYDTLEMEFKKLENNYSSLLKTARAEIERKTQRISQLNIEKDMMVLNSLKNGKRIRRSFNSVQNISNKNANPAKGKDNINGKKIKEACAKGYNTNANNERCEPTSFQTKDVVSSSGSDNRSNVNILENIVPRTESSNNKKSNIMQHIETEHIDAPKATSIKDRRKSVPAVSMQVEKFSSDEESEANNPHKDARIDVPPIDNFKRRNAKKIPYDRHSKKTSETSSIEDRGSNYQESAIRDINRSRTSRHYDDNPYRGKDKYEVCLRYRKHYSPERGQRKGQHREYQDDYHRQDHGRYRHRDNSPQEAYNRHQRKQVESRSNSNRYSHDYDNYNHRYDEKQAAKHRIPNDYDEPHSKRQKTESFGIQDSREDKRYYSDKDQRSVHDIQSPHEYDMLHTSCQSPDYIHNDAAFMYPIKEIMATAATPLDDPRVTSRRYVIKKENGKETLSVVEGRNIDIVPVDKVKWGFKSVPVPDALVRLPSKCSDEVVQEIYMDIDNPVANISLESGEVRCETDDELIDRNKKQKECIIPNQGPDINVKRITEKKLKPSINPEESSTSKQHLSTYRIPKIGKTKTQNKMDIPTIDKNKVNEKASVENDSLTKTKTKLWETGASDEILSKNIKDGKHESERQQQLILSNMAIVADDLELSDDNSDHTDTHKKFVKKKKESKKHFDNKEIRKEDSTNDKKNNSRDECRNDIRAQNKEIRKEDSSSDNKNNSRIEYPNDNKGQNKEIRKEDSTSDKKNNSLNECPNDNKTQKAIEAVVNKNVDVAEKAKESDSAKKHKYKKKKSKSKELYLKEVDTTNVIQVAEKKTVPIKEDNIGKDPKPKEINNKFSDLFGDSNSLMTPEDLGIPSYLPTCEDDAQDAIDMKINQIIDSPPPPVEVSKVVDIAVPTVLHPSLYTLQNKTYKDESNVITENVTQKFNIDDNEIKDIKKKKVSKRKEETVSPKEISPKVIDKNLNPEIDSNGSNVVKTVIISEDIKEISPQVDYKNLNLETDTNESNVVKTVIISEGIQPQFSLQNNQAVLEIPIADVKLNAKENFIDYNQIPSINDLKKQDIIKALATSTPLKEFTALKPIETNTRTTDICDTNLSKTFESGDNRSQVIPDQSGTNTLDSHDVPDVRIFVKRRRKIMKRPPMT